MRRSQAARRRVTPGAFRNTPPPGRTVGSEARRSAKEELMSHAVPSPTRSEALRGVRGKNVLVTGGTSGIGQAIAVRFAEHGANVAINYLRRPEEGLDTEEQVHACAQRVRQEGVRDVLVGGDVSREEEVVPMVADAIRELGGLDVLVNNAGI